MNDRKKKMLGKLTSFGIEQPWQALLLLPEGWDDFTTELESFGKNILPGSNYYFRCRLAQAPKTTFKNKVPRTTAVVVDQEGTRARLMAYGDSRELSKQLESLDSWFYLHATLDRDEETGQIWINNPEIISKDWHGKLRPRYPGKARVIGSQLVRDRILALLDTELLAAAKWLSDELGQYGTREEMLELLQLPPNVTYKNLILRSHTPITLKQGNLAQQSLMRLAALSLINRANRGAKNNLDTEPIPMQRVWSRLETVGFKPTTDQVNAIKEIVCDLESTKPSKRLLAGDVATGKTIVYAAAAAAVADAGYVAIVLLPTAGMVEQVASNMSTWWPDLPIQTVTGDNNRAELTGRVLIGTTALLHRRIHQQPHLLIIDEQQKYSREQREQLMAPHTHLLEVTATPIPRTQALLRYGMVEISQLKKRHNKNKITTRLWTQNDTAELTKEVKKTLAKKQQVLVIYPKREPDQNGKLDLKDIQTAYAGWSKFFPGRVVMAHGGMSDQEKNSALEAMKEGKADVMCATTVVEVGIDLGNLYRIIVVQPERYGLVTLHQLRGRVARKGGQGYCDLLLTREVGEKSQKRLEAFVKESDGFKLAEIDMINRGIGDIALDGDKQSGADESFLYGRPVDIKILDEMVTMIA